MKPAYLIAGIILVASAGVTLFTFANSISRHVSMKQAIEMPGQHVQIPGKIVKGSDTFDPVRHELKFDVKSMDGDQTLTVVYHEAKPENFDSATSVEAEGMYKDGVFHASNLLVKCPSKYNDEKKPDNKKAGKTDLSWWLAAPLAVGAVAWVALLSRERAA